MRVTRSRRALPVLAAVLVLACVTVGGSYVIRHFIPRATDGAVTAAAASIDRRGDSVVAIPKHASGHRLAVYFHGYGQTQADVLSGPNVAPVTAELLRHGFIVASLNADGNAWGDPASVSAYEAFIRSTTNRYHLQHVYFMAESMGGLPAVKVARVIRPEAMVAWYPVHDVRTLTKPDLVSSLRAIYHGRSEAAVAPAASIDVPLRVWASPQDTVVPMKANSLALVRADQQLGGSAELVTSKGDHGDPSNFDPQQVAAFFATH